ncbi:MAG: hypothetical protein J5821_03945 [Alphaproteobacteria bacterium]|nr:hypothetical protein [Alphaproteobacteria bacterium]
MRKSSVVIIGFLVAGNMCGMTNLVPQNNINAEGNQVFLPVMKRRFSEGMINTVVWPAPKRQNRGEVCVGNFLIQQQNSIELPSQNSTNGLRLDQGSVRISVQNNANRSRVGMGYGGLPTPVDSNGLGMGQRYAGVSVQNSSNGAAGFVPQKINGNANENMIFIPTLRNSNIGNQTTNSTSLPQQNNSQGYFPQSGVDDDVSKPIFSLLEVLQIAEQQSETSVEKTKQEMNRKIVDLEHQKEVLERETQYYKERGRHFFPNKIAKLEERVITLEGHIKKQSEKYREETGKLEDQLFALEQENNELRKEVQYYKSGSNGKFLQEITQLKEQVKNLQNQNAEEKSRYEKKTKELEEQVQKERELNLTLSLGT